MTSKNTYAVIMAGGGGTRLWPLSRQAQPKQSLAILGDRSLFQMAVDRLRPMLPPERIWVVTVAEHAQLLMPQAPELPEGNFLIEPSPKGTASVIGLAAAKLAGRDSDAVMACLTADHVIGNEVRFRSILAAAVALAQQGRLVTLGIPATYPATGYGYIQAGAALDAGGDFAAYQVAAFKEKPSSELAGEYVRAGGYYWNSGMFIWRAERILAEIERSMPELHSGLDRIAKALDTPQERAVIEAEWSRLRSQTIDYGVMEHAADVVMLPAEDLRWMDIGGWGRLYDVFPADQSGNVLDAKQVLVVDTKGTLIYQGSGAGQDRLIAALGVEDLVIVDTQDVLLICPRDQAERVRELVKRLSAMKLDRYL